MFRKIPTDISKSIVTKNLNIFVTGFSFTLIDS